MPSIPAIAASRVAAIVAAVAVAFGSAGCGDPDRGPRYRGAGAAGPRRGGTITISNYQSVRTLDPAIAYDEVSLYPIHHLFDTLVGYQGATAGTGLELVPQLAEAWTLSADGTTYLFTLRPGIAFSDGSPVVAGDFVYALERVLTMSDSPFGQFLDGVVGAAELTTGKATRCAGLRAVDDRHLEIRLTSADAAFLYVLAMPFASPQRRAHVERVGDQIRREPLGTGPFRLASWREGERVVVERNPAYWDPALPHIDRLILLENITRDTAFLMFEAGDLDAVDRLSSADYVWIKGRADWAPYIVETAQMNVYGERMNVTMAPFDDVRVRRALNYAVDKARTIKLLNGRGVVSHGMLPPGMLGRDDGLAPYPHDPARARALLAEAGYPDGFAIEYVTLKDEQSEKLAQSLQDDLAAVGVKMKITLMSFPTYIAEIGRRDGASFSFGSWYMDYPDPSNFLDVRYHSRMIADENSNNDTFYSNPELDRLLDEARRETDRDRRVALYHRAERILYDDAPWIWHYHQKMVEVVQPYVRGYEPHPVWSRDFREAWLDLGDEGERLRR